MVYLHPTLSVLDLAISYRDFHSELRYVNSNTNNLAELDALRHVHIHTRLRQVIW